MIISPAKFYFGKWDQLATPLQNHVKYQSNSAVDGFIAAALAFSSTAKRTFILRSDGELDLSN